MSVCPAKWQSTGYYFGIDEPCIASLFLVITILNDSRGREVSLFSSMTARTMKCYDSTGAMW